MPTIMYWAEDPAPRELVTLLDEAASRGCVVRARFLTRVGETLVVAHRPLKAGDVVAIDYEKRMEGAA